MLLCSVPLFMHGGGFVRFQLYFLGITLIAMLQVVEAGLGHLPFAEETVVTPTGHRYVGVSFAKKLCGVSIIRSGESMENALRACCVGIKIGKILVHRSYRS